MSEATQHEKRTEMGAMLNVVLSAVVAVLLALIGFFARDSFERINDNVAAAHLDIRQIRTEMNALELGLRGDRFTRTDWLREKAELERELESIEREITELQQSLQERM